MAQMALCAGSRLLDDGLRCHKDGIWAEDRMYFMRTRKKEFSQCLTDPTNQECFNNLRLAKLLIIF